MSEIIQTSITVKYSKIFPIFFQRILDVGLKRHKKLKIAILHIFLLSEWQISFYKYVERKDVNCQVQVSMT